MLCPKTEDKTKKTPNFGGFLIQGCELITAVEAMDLGGFLLTCQAIEARFI